MDSTLRTIVYEYRRNMEDVHEEREMVNILRNDVTTNIYGQPHSYILNRLRAEGNISNVPTGTVLILSYTRLNGTRLVEVSFPAIVNGNFLQPLVDIDGKRSIPSNYYVIAGSEPTYQGFPKNYWVDTVLPSDYRISNIVWYPLHLHDIENLPVFVDTTQYGKLMIYMVLEWACESVTFVFDIYSDDYIKEIYGSTKDNILTLEELSSARSIMADVCKSILSRKIPNDFLRRKPSFGNKVLNDIPLYTSSESFPTFSKDPRVLFFNTNFLWNAVFE